MTVANINGAKGEQIAAKFLIKKGYDIVAMNYRSKYGEIDIIATDDEYVLFVEVKTRSENAMSLPKEAVTKSKQHKIISTAMRYITASKTELQPRFDIIEVYIKNKTFGKNQVHHIKNAFWAEGYI